MVLQVLSWLLVLWGSRCEGQSFKIIAELGPWNRRKWKPPSLDQTKCSKWDGRGTRTGTPPQGSRSSLSLSSLVPLKVFFFRLLLSFQKQDLFIYFPAACQHIEKLQSPAMWREPHGERSSLSSWGLSPWGLLSRPRFPWPSFTLTGHDRELLLSIDLWTLSLLVCCSFSYTPRRSHSADKSITDMFSHSVSHIFPAIFSNKRLIF